jgi:predicted dehydrogenase/threonine dehydrogenase-like Zn-dependent dehydrogenase
VKQILQSLRSGLTDVADVPSPAAERGGLLIHTSRTLISAGTERMLVDFGKANFIQKALQQPDKVRMVIEKIRTDGLMPTIESVFNKLDQPMPLGYCNVGVVREIGAGVQGFAVGDRVASNGRHAEMVSVPVNLCARIPDNVTDDHASFVVLGAIALQGVRLAQPTVGETVAVTGLGLIGLVTVQILRAQGCRVLGIDFDPAKLAMARQFGATTVDLKAGQDPVVVAQSFSRGRGVDAVIITAATKSNEPMHQAALMCRQRGRIVLVGVTGLELSRDDFYKKELTFQVSSSYGPGRYDPNYEDKGQDYPVGFVRWTAQRNFEAVLDMMSSGALNVGPLISHRFPVADASKAYALVAGDAGEPSLGIVLTYPSDGAAAAARTVAIPAAPSLGPREPAVSVIGSGNYVSGMLLPSLKAAGVSFRTIASRSGVSSLHAGRKFGFQQTTTDTDSIFADALTTAVVIGTRHDSHARFVLRSLKAGKHVFVEKPLCLTIAELDEIEAACGGGAAAPILMVGFNRRFAPQVQRVKQLLAGVPGPKSFIMTVNAGAIPPDHWTQDVEIGGGRIIGEGCHFIDLLRFLAGERITDHRTATMTSATNDTLSLHLAFADGSLGTIHYFANGTKAFPKERLEVFAQGRVLQLDNFRTMRGFNWPGATMNLWRQDKGHRACAAAFVDAVRRGAASPIPLAEILEVSRVSIEAAAR